MCAGITLFIFAAPRQWFRDQPRIPHASQITSLPSHGESVFWVETELANSFSDWTLKAVRLNGVDVTDRGVDVRANEDVGGFEVELTNRLTHLSGLVTDRRGEYVAEYVAVVFSRTREKWGAAGRYFRIGQPGQDESVEKGRQELPDASRVRQVD